MERLVVSVRTEHPAWGGRKIARRLADLGHVGVPSASTVTQILRRHGLIDPAQSAAHRAFRRFERDAPNELWQMDFKGHFATEHGGRCHALTVLDDHCRYNLGLRACADERDATVRGQLTALFRRYGQPKAILADNGSPWGSAGSGGMHATALEVWLMQHGIGVLHGRPRHPQTQGKEERFHRTLDVELLQHNRFADLVACQGAFDRWRQVYNEQRPHEALGLATPASRYQPSPRSFSDQPAAPDYATTDTVRRVSADGYVSFAGRKLKLSQAYAGQPVALRPTAQDSLWTIHFSRFVIAQIDLRDHEAEHQPVKHVPNTCQACLRSKHSLGPHRDHALAMHPTVKPTAMVADAIRDCTKRGNIVLAPFAGSGTTLIAAELCGRAARLIEYDPLYCDTIIRRYERFTGKAAVLVENGETFEETTFMRRDESNAIG